MIRCLFFGICLAASQAENLRGQGTGLRLPADTVELRQQIRRLLDDPGGTKFAEAVRLVRSLGQAAAPVAWELQASYRGGATRRLEALVLAAVAEEDPATLLRSLQRAGVEDRMTACLVMGALEREGPADILQLVGGGERLPLRLAVAALAVAPRGAACDRVQDAHRDDPGIVAAALLSGSALDCDLRPWLAEDRRRPHADLVLRGLFLGQVAEDLPTTQMTVRPARGTADTPVVRAAEDAFKGNSLPQEVREAAALLLASRGLIKAADPSPPHELLWHSVATAGVPEPGSPCAWLGWRPPTLTDQLSPGAPGRLAVCFALLQPFGTALASLDDAKLTPAVADDLALALAMRKLRAGRAAATAPAQAASGSPLGPCRSWLAWAMGTLGAPVTGSGDERLDAAAGLAAEGRLPPAAAARLLEDALWMRGSHPRLAVRAARLRLVRDLLLSGSNAGARYVSGPRHEVYAPRDLPREDQWFDAALPAWDVLSPQVLPLPDRHRLR